MANVTYKLKTKQKVQIQAMDSFHTSNIENPQKKIWKTKRSTLWQTDVLWGTQGIPQPANSNRHNVANFFIGLKT